MLIKKGFLHPAGGRKNAFLAESYKKQIDTNHNSDRSGSTRDNVKKKGPTTLETLKELISRHREFDIIDLFSDMNRRILPN